MDSFISFYVLPGLIVLLKSVVLIVALLIQSSPRRCGNGSEGC